MPIHLAPRSSRRQFLGQLTAAGIAWSQSSLNGEETANSGLVAILNDTHIGGQQQPDSNIPRHLRETVEWLLRPENRPAAVIINGDLALKDGQPEDYQHFARLIQPLRDAGVPVHLTMGNHDERDVFYQVLTDLKPEHPVVAAKHVAVVRLPLANLFLLDSLKETMITPGLLGSEQLHWLGRALDAHADRPALIFAHHNPRLGGDPVHFPGGLEDSGALWQLLTQRPHVKAYVHGHIHHRDYFAHEGIHILNTPATSYVANPASSTTGWTMLRLAAASGRFTTHTHLEDHPWNRVVKRLPWR